MPNQQAAFYQSPMERRRFLLDPDECPSRRSHHRFAEVAGGATAECTAVVCCVPCTVVDFLVLAVYKVPKGLYRKAKRKKRRRRLLKKGLLSDGGVVDGHRISFDGTEFFLSPPAGADAAERFVMGSIDSDEDLIELDDEMWERFYGTGFWRSLSQRVDPNGQTMS